jgi:hypothetical protein
MCIDHWWAVPSYLQDDLNSAAWACRRDITDMAAHHAYEAIEKAAVAAVLARQRRIEEQRRGGAE